MQFPVRNASTVIPACPESFPPQRKDSGQAGMTLGFYFFNERMPLIFIEWH
jgi:hypothetical protein